MGKIQIEEQTFSPGENMRRWVRGCVPWAESSPDGICYNSSRVSIQQVL